MAQDIDRTAAMMCYIQMSLLGCPAIVAIGDSLAKPFPHPDNEVWCTLFYHLNQWRFTTGEAGSETADGMETADGIETTGGSMERTMIRLSGNMELLEGADGQLMLCMERAS